MLTTHSVLSTEDGIPTAVATVATDVSELMRVERELRDLKRSLERRIDAHAATEQALRERERVHRTLLANLPGMVYRCRNDADWTMRWVSEGCLELTGFRPEQLIDNAATTYGALIHPDDRERIWDEVQAALVEKRSFQLEYRIRSADGTEKWVWERGCGVFGEHGEETELEGFVADVSGRRRAEIELRASEVRRQILFENAPDAIYLMDLKGVFVDGNRAAEEAIGYSRHELIGRSVFTTPVLALSDLPAASAVLMRAALGQPTGPDEFVLRRKGGGTTVVEIRTYPVMIEGRRLVLGIARDISDRKAAEAALDRANRRNQLILGAAGDGILGIDEEKRVMFANPAAVAMLGRPESRLIGQPICAVIHGGRHPPSACPLLVEFRKGGGARDDAAVFVGDGREFPAGYVMTPIIQDGSEEGAVLVFEDATERRAAQERIQLQSAALEAVANAILITDSAGSILWANPAMSDLTGYTADELVGRSTRVFKSGKQDSAFYRELWERITAGNVWRGEVVNRRKDGTLYPEEMTITPVSGPNGEIQQFIAVKQDVSERRSLTAQLHQAQKLEAVGQLAGGIAHDFNNLLTVILGASDLALAALSDDDPARALVTEIRGSGERAAELTQRLLAFSRKELVEPTVFRPTESVEALERMLRSLIGETVDLVVRMATDTGTVRADRHQLEQVLINLAINARDAMPDGGTVEIETMNVALDEAYADAHHGVKSGDYVLLTVTDSGCGMTHETSARIFEPFFSTKAVGERTGLGLSTSHGIVAQWGGHIAVYSEVDVGTTMKVYLPRVADAPTERVRAPAQALAGTETILLVEDEPAVRAVAARILRRQGYTVLEAESGEEALSEMARIGDEVDLMLTDVVLPGIGGRQLADQVLAHRPEARILFTTGYTEDAVLRKRLLDVGVSLLQKPFTIESLTTKVREALDAP